MSQSSSSRGQAKKEAGRARQWFAIRMFVPLLLGFIPIVIILPALGISGKLAAGIFYGYILAYFIVQFLLLRRSMRATLRQLRTSQIANPVPIGPSRREKEIENMTKPKVVDEADLKLCPHCGSAVSRNSADKCPSCGHSLE
ncbi:MAG TPA: hypothetical protein VGS11_12460 [Candidatus Bathyarchaeia archaeon]|nr:hypothetical protein [Candidatus Bathyarchaeia archaeon]